MIYGMWLSAAGMFGNQYRQDIAANNLANVNTVGFKHDLALLLQRPVESQEDAGASGSVNYFYDLLSGGTFVKPTRHNFAQGPSLPTGQPLDAMIQGQGFFQVETPEGIRYTRDGRFLMNEQGQLVTVAGAHAVLSDGGIPIQIGSGVAPHIDEQGRVRQGNNPVATLGVVEFDDVQKLRKQGGNLFVATEDATPLPASHSKVIPNVLEGATVNAIDGMVDMVKITRSFEMNANMLKLQDATLGRAVNDIARV